MECTMTSMDTSPTVGGGGSLQYQKEHRLWEQINSNPGSVIYELVDVVGVSIYMCSQQKLKAM